MGFYALRARSELFLSPGEGAVNLTSSTRGTAGTPNPQQGARALHDVFFCHIHVEASIARADNCKLEFRTSPHPFPGESLNTQSPMYTSTK